MEECAEYVHFVCKICARVFNFCLYNYNLCRLNVCVYVCVSVCVCLFAIVYVCVCTCRYAPMFILVYIIIALERACIEFEGGVLECTETDRQKSTTGEFWAGHTAAGQIPRTPQKGIIWDLFV